MLELSLNGYCHTVGGQACFVLVVGGTGSPNQSVLEALAPPGLEHPNAVAWIPDLECYLVSGLDALDFGGDSPEAVYHRLVALGEVSSVTASIKLDDDTVFEETRT